MYNPKFKSLITSALIFSTFVAGCSNNSGSSSQDSDLIEDASVISSDINVDNTTENITENIATNLSAPTSESSINLENLFTNNDLNPIYTGFDATINLNNNSIKSDSPSVSINGSVATITSGGIYKITGTLDDGQIIVNTTEKIWLLLDDANINCSNSAPIYIINADKAFITLCENTTNNLSDGSNYVYLSEDENEPDAVIFSKDDLTINGAGTLNITANFNEGITSKNDITITGGSINIISVGNAIKGKDSVAITKADITIDSNADGIKSTNADEENKGFVYIKDGTFNITSAEDSIQAEQQLIITGGTLNLLTGTGSANTPAKSNDDFGFGGGGRGGQNPFEFGGTLTPPNVAEQTATQTLLNEEVTIEDDTSISTKSLKAGLAIYIEGGNITADSYDDAIHSNGSVFINNGNLILSAGDDGIHADSEISITDGSINILSSYEGIESTVINISGGEISLFAIDDGFNASDGSSTGAMGQNTANTSLNISGGVIYVNADGDGLDSNGSIYITGGTTIVDGPTNSGNGALDSNNEIIVDGGVLIAVGSAGMAEAPSSTSSQQTLDITVSNQNAGSSFTICDSSGSEVLTYTPDKNYSSIIVNMPNLLAEESYILYTGSSSSAENKYGLYQVGGYNNDGTDVGSFQTGVTSNGGMGNMGQGNKGGFGGQVPEDFNGQIPKDFNPEDFNGQIPKDFNPEDFDGQIPEDFNPEDFNGQIPEDFNPEDFDGQRPNGKFPNMNMQEQITENLH